jgi:hypothetical protein
MLKYKQVERKRDGRRRRRSLLSYHVLSSVYCLVVDVGREGAARPWGAVRDPPGWSDERGYSTRLGYAAGRGTGMMSWACIILAGGVCFALGVQSRRY